MHNAWEFGKEGPVYEFEFYDGTPLDLEETGSYLEPRKVLLQPRKRHHDRELQAHMNEIIRDFRAGMYPKWIYITGTYVDQIGQTWIRGFRDEGEDVVDYIFNSTFWGHT